MDIISRYKIWFTVSTVLIIGSLTAIFLIKPNLGIDFTGGSLLEIKTTNQLKKEDVEKSFADLGIKVEAVNKTGEGSMLIRTQEITEEKKNEAISRLNEKKENKRGAVEERRFETIGPTISSDLLKKAIKSVLFASIAIVLYIAFAFRKLPDQKLSWRFGLTAVIALIHDIIITTGVFVFLSRTTGWEINSFFITALLTVMGFSVHDTIVVFDRLRENLINHKEYSFSSIANASIVQTLARSINTSFTMLVTLAALFLLGGASIKPFVFTLFIGILIGTYSSIFLATPIVVAWQRNKTIKFSS